MGFLYWLVEGLAHWCVYIQICNDTGWLQAQFERMPHVMNQVHSALTIWVAAEDEEKK